MSKKTKGALGVAVSIFAPMFAPWAAGALLSSSATALTKGALAAGIGAAGGAAGANLQGADWRKGAVLGGLTGGVLSATGGGLTPSGRPPVLRADAVPAAAATPPPTFMQRLQNISGDALVQSGTQLGLGFAGMRAEDKMLAAETAERQRVASLQQEMFNRQVKEAEEMKALSAQYDPQRFGQQQANQFGRQLEQQRREQLRGLAPGQTGREEAIGRQFDIAKATGRGTAYAGGYGAGLDIQQQFRSAAAGLYPSTVPERATPTMADVAAARGSVAAQVGGAAKALEPITSELFPKKKKAGEST